MATALEFTDSLEEMHHEWRDVIHISYLAFSAMHEPKPRYLTEEQEREINHEYQRMQRIEDVNVSLAEGLHQKILENVVAEKEYSTFEKAAIISGFLGNYRIGQHKMVRQRADLAFGDLNDLNELLSTTGEPFCVVTVNEHGKGKTEGAGITVDPSEFLRTRTRLTVGQCSIRLGLTNINWSRNLTSETGYGSEVPKLPRRFKTITDPEFTIEPIDNTGVIHTPVYIYGGDKTVRSALRIVPKLMSSANDFPY